ncbi:hypothetical protein [Maledivibacter halophilus]|uniref:Uncharacterized protein n=1 Tax=Maledivibacter halophilus TaxID=36842 RepID=A0A1T5L0S8_9FIRM|nr:hypothetical protein [Maledivibacter halophilus]SKC68988.1 hypothetical protein SAMN02194393_02196 [Maledivibacter halophilus]
MERDIGYSIAVIPCTFNLSYIVFREDKPVGVILGGIKIGEDFKTLRCGG